jgi:hypothetical protein
VAAVRSSIAAFMAAALVAGCATRPMPAPDPVPAPAPPAAAPDPAPAPAPPPSSPDTASYECGDGTRLRVLPQGDVLVVEELPGGPYRLGRDAGGFTPEHTVWSGPQLRVELGLGPKGEVALVQSLYPPQTVECRRR